MKELIEKGLIPLTDYSLFCEVVDAIRSCGNCMRAVRREDKQLVYQERIRAICKRVETEFDDFDGSFSQWLWCKPISSAIAGSAKDVPLNFGSDRQLIFVFLCLIRRRNNKIEISRSDVRYFYSLLKKHCPGAPGDMFQSNFNVGKEFTT